MKYAPRLKIYRGSNGKNTYQPDTKQFRSYEHWVYCQPIRGVWVFNQYSYSKTTNGHQSEGKHFLETELGVSLNNVVFCNQRESLSRGLNLDTPYENMILLELKLKREKRAKNRSEIIEQLAGVRANVARLRKLGFKTSRPAREMKKYIEQREIERLTEQRETSRAARLAYAAKRAALNAEHGSKLSDVSEVSI